MKQNNSLVIGLTGGIASGKTTVSGLLKKHGFNIFDADQRVHELLDDCQEIQQTLTDFFGDEVISKDKKVNRKKLGDIIFNDEEKRKKLNHFIHPILMQEVRKKVQQLHSNQPLIIDAALLVESGFYKEMDYTIMVYCPFSIQLERLMKRNNLTKKEAMIRIQSQMTVLEKLPAVDIIISNHNSLEELENRVVRIIRLFSSSDRKVDR